MPNTGALIHAIYVIEAKEWDGRLTGAFVNLTWLTLII